MGVPAHHVKYPVLVLPGKCVLKQPNLASSQAFPVWREVLFEVVLRRAKPALIHREIREGMLPLR